MDNVNHPSHYTNASVSMEPIDVCKHLSFCQGNAIKYVSRFMYKNNSLEDLKKALWYIECDRDMNNYLSAEAEVLLKFYALHSNELLANAMTNTIKKYGKDSISFHFWEELEVEINLAIKDLEDA